MSTNIPAIQWNSTGLVLPTEADILAGAQADIDTAFGGGVNPALTTPQGQIASTETAIVGDKNSQIAQVVNQVDPAYAEGRMQDAIGRIYFIERLPATATVVLVTLNGAAGVVVPAAWPVGRDTAGNIYVTTGATTIPVGGTATSVQVQNQTTGPIACPAGTLTAIYKAIPGLDTITNPADGVLGRDVENRADFEFRRQNSIAKNGNGSLQSIYGAVLGVAGVLDAYAYENYSGVPINVGSTSYTMAPHSIYIAVVGGNSADVAAAIWSKKNPGCDMNGNTTVTVYDKTNYEPPFPSYDITYNIPTSVVIHFEVHIADNPALPSDIESQVQAAIVATFNGSNGGARARIGQTIYASTYYPAVLALSPFMGIEELNVGTTTSPTTTFTAIGVDQTPTLSIADVVVTRV